MKKIKTVWDFNLHLVKMWIKPFVYIMTWYISMGLILISQSDLDLAIKTWSEIMYYLMTGLYMYYMLVIMYWSLWAAHWWYYNMLKKGKELSKEE